ncbi:MAG: hypothetical protein K9M98_02060 [Cephaloticoccus sp.]|nr:hypothetical protein [Cephaloticoccus sp.]MCF7759264.1 hypothetical protein [Cephaloticoccus sp.]
MKLSFVCHGNIARSQILHSYVAHHAAKASLELDLFSCGTAAREFYPEADRLLSDVESELHQRGLQVSLKRAVMDEPALQHLLRSDFILVADEKRRQEVLVRLGASAQTQRVNLFYQFIGEGRKDFVDTYDADEGAQDQERFARCFDELERIAILTVEKIRSAS